MFTRDDYINCNCSHNEYYGQFVTNRHKNLVINAFGIEKLEAAYKSGSFFNTIPLSLWDNLTNSLISDSSNEALRKAGDFPTLAGRICILKEAATKVVKETK